MKTTFTHIAIVLAFFGFSTVNAQWQQANTGLTVNDANSFASVGNKLFVSTGNIGGNGTGVFVSTDNGSNWTAANNGLPNTDTKKIIAVGNDLFVALGGNGTNGGVYFSSDNGANWTAKNNGLPYPYASQIAALGNTLYTTMPGGSTKVYTSVDNGANWVAATDPVLKDITVKSIVSIGGNLVAASDNNNKGVYFSTDNGVTWNATSINNDEGDCLAVIGTTVFAATSSGVFKSIDNGATWTATTNVGGVIDNATALSVIGTTLIVGCPYSVYSSTDNGTTWTDISLGAGGANLSIEAFGQDASYIYIGNTFHPVGVWRRHLTELGVPNGISADLGGNGKIYPNPFSDQLSIELSDYKNSTVDLFTIQGQLVQHVSLQGQKTQLNTSELQSGMYILKVSGAAGTSVQKIVRN